jgi:hypothetical protein
MVALVVRKVQHVGDVLIIVLPRLKRILASGVANSRETTRVSSNSHQTLVIYLQSVIPRDTLTLVIL